MKKLILSLALACIVSFPAFAFEHEQALRDSFKDPGAVEFKEITTKPVDGGTVICGKVNGKNSYGAYTGFTDFIAIMDRGELGYLLTAREVPTTDFRGKMREVCH